MTTDEQTDPTIATITVNEIEYPVRLTRWHRFAVTVAGASVESERWDDLEAKIRTAGRKAAVKVSVPFVTRSGRVGTATGIHAGTKRVMVRWADSGKTEQADAINEPLRADVDLVKLRELNEAVRDADRALKEFCRTNRLTESFGGGYLSGVVLQAVESEIAKG
jgi:hypothetical protein